MAKRFIDTGLFRKPLVRSMSAPYKALFIYLLCECDHAGIWDVELDVAAMRLGMELDDQEAARQLGDAVVVIDGGAKWWVREFVEFQYGELNPANRVHASVIARLQSAGIDPLGEGASKGLASPLQGAKDKDKDKEKDIQEGKERATSTTRPDLTIRRQEFEQEVKTVNAALPPERKLPDIILEEFIGYWTEPTQTARPRLRCETEKTWDTARRIGTWRRIAEEKGQIKAPIKTVWNANR